jgi:hypothetical protein
MNRVYSGNNTKHGALPGTMKFGWEKKLVADQPNGNETNQLKCNITGFQQI